MMKKLIAATLVCAAMATCMVGCGKDKPKDKAESIPSSSIVMSESEVSSDVVTSGEVTSEDASMTAKDETAIEKSGSDISKAKADVESTSTAASSVKAD